MTKPEIFVQMHMPPVSGGPCALYDGKLRQTQSGSLYICEQYGIPSQSTTFWRADAPLIRDSDGKRIHYRYGHVGSGPKFAYVGFKEPAPEIPEGTLVRISLAHWWQPRDRPEEERRCFAQVSGWFDVQTPGLEASKSAASAASGVPVVASDRLCATKPAIEHSPSLALASRGDASERITFAESALMKDARTVLATVFGYPDFRPMQEDVIGSVLGGVDTLAVMPTGSGKSLCFQVPGLVASGLTVVVSPLVALMQDQVDQFQALGVHAVTLNSSLPHSEYVRSARAVRSGEARFLYVAPETLLRPETLLLLDQSSVRFIVVDEAHCISEWGHDFRPEYRQIRSVRGRYARATCVALTATATDRVRADIQSQLGISEADCFVASFDRPNLYLEVRRRDKGFGQVLGFLRDHPGDSGVVYCATRDQVDTLTAFLERNSLEALAYHAGMEDTVRRANQRKFQRDDSAIIVATIAFGMGINKPNIRFVLHYALPDSLETYYQQVGRAGRDGFPAQCMLLFGRSDVATTYRFIEQGEPGQRAGRAARLQAMLRYAEATSCRRKPLLTYFGDPAPEQPCGECDNCHAENAGRTLTDVSEDARLLLSCLDQTRQRFGVVHVVEVLRGSQAARVVNLRHDQLPSHGSGKHRSKESWRQLADRLIEAGLIEQDMEHGILRMLTPGRKAIAGDPVFVPLEDSRPAPRAQDRAQMDAGLFDHLRKLRRRLADDANVPAYVIFSDRSLADMAARIPTSREEFLQVHGVGARKAEAYADLFLCAIREYLQDRGDTTEVIMDADAGDATERRFWEVGTAFAAGESIATLAVQWRIRPDTIVQHLIDFLRAGGSVAPARLRAEGVLDDEDWNRAVAAFEEYGHRPLRPVYDALEGSVSYTALRLIYAYRLSTGEANA